MKKEIGNEIGERLKKIRLSNNYSTNKFAEVLGIAQSAVTKIENGNSEPSTKTIQLLIEKFGVDPLWLLTGKTNNAIQSPAALKLAKLVDKLPEAVQFLFVMLAERETLLENFLEQKKNAENNNLGVDNTSDGDG